MRGPRTAMKSGPRLPQLEKALAQKRRPNTAKNLKKKKKVHNACMVQRIIFLKCCVCGDHFVMYKNIELRQEGRGQGTTIERMTQPLRRTGYDKNWLEPTRRKMAED